jgi:phosphoribosylformylglycinamidine cyclo-ligase
MGVGFCIITPKDQATRIKAIFKKHKITTQEIGQVVSKKGVFVNSSKIT